MMFLRMAEAFVAIMVLLFVATQIVIPLWRVEQPFPLFRSRGRAEEALREARSQWQEKRVAREARAVAKQADNFDKDTNEPL